TGFPWTRSPGAGETSMIAQAWRAATAGHAFLRGHVRPWEDDALPDTGARMASHSCPKCSSSMDEGFVVDHTHGATMQSAWVEGQPRKSFWTGLKLSGSVKHPVTT